MKVKLLFCFLELILPVAIGQDNEPGLPSNMPAPPKDPTPAGGQGRRPGGPNGVANAALPGSVLPNPPPQNAPVEPPPPAATLPPPVPFGLNHIILILVPQFKTKIPHLPKWMGANTKVSLPITIFFDKLKVAQPPPPGPYTPYSPFYGPYYPGGHFVKRRSVEKLLEQNNGAYPTESNNDSDYKDNVRRSSSSLHEATFRAERVTLIPKLENLLGSFGLGGKSCLLRTICESHEFPHELHHGYGLLGEVLTLFFSISRSAFANSHLREYLEAEDVGKSGNCRRYFKECGQSLFFWEKIHGNETDLEEEELFLLNQLF